MKWHKSVNPEIYRVKRIKIFCFGCLPIARDEDIRWEKKNSKANLYMDAIMGG